jgi:hypothetical protein
MNISNDKHLTVSVRVETQIPGAPPDVLDVPVPAGRSTVAQIVRAKAGVEWDALCHGERSAAGRESAPPQAGEAPDVTSRDAAIRAALDAYRAGWFVVFVDGELAAALDASVEVGPGTMVRFVRLYPV